jgi:colanic acid biosynthesis protein WcaH
MKIIEQNIPKKIYREIMEWVPIFTVDVIFFNKEKTKTLLFKRENEPLKKWYFSLGGRVLKNEELKKSAVRKVKEEIGIDIFANDLFGEGLTNEIHETSIFENCNVHNINVQYGAIWKEEYKISFDSQHTEAKWFSINDELLHPFIKTRIKNLLS